LATAGVAVVLTAASIPAPADELVQNLGPVGPREPILATVGNTHVIAFYEPDSGTCDIHVVVWNLTDANAESTVSFVVTLNPRQIVHVGTPEHETLDLQCGDSAKSLAIADTAKFVPTQSR